MWKQRRELGPLLLIIFAAPLVLLNPVMNLAFDYQKVTETHALAVLVNILTWFGTIQMMTGSLWHSNIAIPACFYACFPWLRKSSVSRLAEAKAQMARDAL